MATSPTRQPKLGQDHVIADHVAQLAATQFMRSQQLAFRAAGTDRPIADPISRISTHRVVVLVDLQSQICHT
jgi:hypothetical protein